MGIVKSVRSRQLVIAGLVFAMLGCSNRATISGPVQSSTESSYSIASLARRPNPLAPINGMLPIKSLPNDPGYEPAPVSGRPGYFRLRDGSVILGPPNELQRLRKLGYKIGGDAPSDVAGTPSLIATSTPPPTDTNGAFRRMYSDGILSAAVSSGWILGPSQPGMPLNAPNGSTGFIYIEGWPGGFGGDNAEGGIFWNPGSQKYALYWSNDVEHFHSGTMLFSPQTFSLGLAQVCVQGTNCTQVQEGVVALGSGNGDQHITPEIPGWTGVSNCCAFALDTSIAQKTDQFKDGVIFQNIEWDFNSPAITETWYPDLGYYQTGPSVFVGGQRFPDNSSKVIVTNFQSWSQETDEIDLHP
jgi:hypothetical protein